MSEAIEITPPSAVAHLPPSLQCRDCQSATAPTALMLKSGQVKAYCDVMHLISYDSEEPEDLITSCSKYQPPQEE